MAGDVKASPDRTWIPLGSAVAMVIAAALLYSRVEVLETNSSHANKQLERIAESLDELADKQDGEREKLGNLDARVTSLEQWREEQRERASGSK